MLFFVLFVVLNTYSKTIIGFGLSHDIENYQCLTRIVLDDCRYRAQRYLIIIHFHDHVAHKEAISRRICRFVAYQKHAVARPILSWFHPQVNSDSFICENDQILLCKVNPLYISRAYKNGQGIEPLLLL